MLGTQGRGETVKPHEPWPQTQTPDSLSLLSSTPQGSGLLTPGRCQLGDPQSQIQHVPDQAPLLPLKPSP